jgi:hypothetical protein
MAQPDPSPSQAPSQRPDAGNAPSDTERSLGTGPLPGRPKDDPASAPESGDKPEAATPRNPQR